MSQYTPEYIASVIEERKRRAGVQKQQEESIVNQEKEDLLKKIPPSVGYMFTFGNDSGGSNPS